ncbi:MAG: hypothetical protein WCP96_02355 [Methylococcaceae bacterium]
MDIFDKLLSESKVNADLHLFLEDNIDELYDFLLTQSFSDLEVHKEKIERYISANLRIIKQLDFTIESTHVFALLLLDISERFGFLMPFQQLYNLLIKHNCEISSRLEASALYLIGIKNIIGYDNILEPLLDKLNHAYLEEDTEDKIISTIVNYYAEIAYNFGSQNLEGVLSIKSKILNKRNDPGFYFLKNNLINEVLIVDLTDHISSYKIIKNLLDVFLKRTKKYIPFDKKLFLIEKNTAYSKFLENVPSTFNAIKQISVNQYSLIKNDSIFYSLKSGVNILTEESQLYAYLHSYGDMHYKKLSSAFKCLPPEILNSEINIVDWGCGQGLATISFIDYFNDNVKINHISLIEPSEIALKRAALHIVKFNESISLKTINKDFDNLNSSDFLNKNQVPTLHLFSNIIDIDLFSLTELLKLINSTFDGENYFVCVSPCINVLRTGRLDRFMKSFSKNNGYQEIKSIDNEKGSWSGTSWSRVIRVFKATL